MESVQARGQHAEALAALESPLGSAMTLANEREQLRAELTVRPRSTPAHTFSHYSHCKQCLSVLMSLRTDNAHMAGGNGLHGQGG